MPSPSSSVLAGLLLLALGLVGCGADPPPADAPPPAPAPPPLPTQGAHDAGVHIGGLRTAGVDEGCAPCHEEVVAAYATSGMRQSLSLPTGAGSPEAASLGTVVRHPATGMTVRLDAGPAGYSQVLYYEDPSGIVRASYGFPMDVVVGSGHVARSYAAIRNGVLLGLPLAWYRELQGLGVAPGTVWQDEALHFQTRACIGCHTGRITPRSTDFELGYTGDLTLGIGCARCHGDGTTHNETGDPRDIVNPARLDLDAQGAVCFQCHMGGAMTLVKPGADPVALRPGSPVGTVVGAFVPAGVAADGTSVAGHAERMRASRCFSARPDMTCTTCHNPHEGHKDADTARRVSSGCGICHGAEACAEPAHGRGDRLCAECHMARRISNDISHARITDHHVQRRLPPRAELDAAPQGHRIRRAAFDDVPLLNLLDPDDALPGSKALKADAYLRGYEMSGRRARGYLERARVRALEAVQEAPGDPAARLVHGRALHYAGRAREARRVLSETAEEHPSHLAAHAALAFVEADLGLAQAAVERLAAVWARNPHAEHVPAVLAEQLARARRFDESLAVLERARSVAGPKLRWALAAADAAQAAGQPARALEHLWDALIFRPRDPQLLARAGALLAQTGGPREEALALLARAAALAPGDPAIQELLRRARSASK